MNSQLYISTISPYYAQVCPEGPLNRPASNIYREISRNLQPPAQGLHSSFAIEVVKYIQHFHHFDYKPYLGAPATFSLIIDILSRIDFWTKQIHALIHSIRDIKKGKQSIIPN